MTTPVLHLVAGSNGSGKTTFVERVLAPSTHLPFINADLIAAREWPGDEMAHAYDASRLAADARARAFALHASFITETVFSHPSKVELVEHAHREGYLISLHVILVPLETSVNRVHYRVRRGGHDVPDASIRSRYERLWRLIAQARTTADQTVFYDNTRASTPFRVVARFRRGSLTGAADWPAWTPSELVD
jgi:predicted ABC-type ATPase